MDEPAMCDPSTSAPKFQLALLVEWLPFVVHNDLLDLVTCDANNVSVSMYI